MQTFSEAYLQEVTETQGKLFDEVREYEPGIDVKRFICDYMAVEPAALQMGDRLMWQQ